MCFFSVGILIMLRSIDISKIQKEGSRLIGASYMSMSNEFFRMIHEQVRVRVEAEGDRVILRDPGMDVQRQKEQIREMMKMGIDALISIKTYLFSWLESYTSVRFESCSFKIEYLKCDT